jgi:hypothetical protein
MLGALCDGLCVGVHKHLVSDFSVAYWGWLEEGSFQWSAPPLIQYGRYGCHLGFGFRRLETKRLCRLIRFLCGLLGVTTGRVLSMIGSVAHPRWPPSLFSFPSIWAQVPGSIDLIFLWLFGVIIGQTPGSIDPIFLWLIGGDYRKVPFNDQLRRSSKMAAILELVSVD